MPKKAPRKSSRKPSTVTKRKAVPRVRMGVPTVRDRINTIDRSVVTAAAAIGVSYDELSAEKPRVRAVKLSCTEVELVAKILQSASGASWWLAQSLATDVLDQLAPTDDQRKALEPLPEIGGAR